MIVGIGTDIVQNLRIAKAIERFGDKFLLRILSLREQIHLEKEDIAQIAARFAAKEAVVKALGTGFSQGIGFNDIEIISLPSGQVQVQLSGAAQNRALELGVANIQLSLSHEREYSIAFVVMESL